MNEARVALQSDSLRLLNLRDEKVNLPHALAND
jgi:hypothetical protein